MASVSFADSDVVLTDLTTYDFTSSIGANGGNDSLYFLVAGRSTAGASSVSSVTVDGVAASLIVQKSQASGAITCVGALYAIPRKSLPNPANTTVTVSVAFSAGMIRAVCDAYVSPNAGTTAFATASAGDAADAGDITLTLSVDTPANGIVIAGGYVGNIGPYAWTGLTEDHDSSITVEGPNQWSSASASNVSVERPRLITVQTASSSQPIGLAASFPTALSPASMLIGI